MQRAKVQVSIADRILQFRKKTAGALQEFCYHWCNAENVKASTLNKWKLNLCNIIDKRISFYSNNLDFPLSDELKVTFRHLKKHSVTVHPLSFYPYHLPFFIVKCNLERWAQFENRCTLGALRVVLCTKSSILLAGTGFMED